MMINVVNHLKEIETELITFSDDMDGLRKVPDNIPNTEILKKNLGKPLSSIPDPFKKFDSFAEHNNTMLKEFLKKNLILILILKAQLKTTKKALLMKLSRGFQKSMTI